MSCPAVLAKDLVKRYRQGQRVVEAVRGVSLALRTGEIFALLGPNGAGKTTVVKMLAGLVEPDAGSIDVMGADPYAASSVRGLIGAVLEGNRNLYWRLTALENLIYFGVLRGLSKQEAQKRGIHLLEALGLADRAHQTVGTLSRGLQQRLAVAAAVVHDPPVLFLDEPTLGVDIESQEALKIWMQALKTNKAILLTTHQLDFAETVADRVAIILQGTIAVGGRTTEILEGSPRVAYRVELMGPLDDRRRLALEQLGVQLDGTTVRVAGEEALWAVLRCLDPVPLGRIERESLSLSELFWRTLRGVKEEHPCCESST